MSRRAFVRWGVTSAAAMVAPRATVSGGEPPPDFGLPVLGTVQAVPSKAIAASPLSVGFETLDRKHFDPARTYGHLARLGVKWARCQTGWNRCEAARGQLDFAWLDAVVNALLDLGVQPWFNLGYGNKLYIPQAPDDYAVGWAPVFDAEARAAWLRFVQAIADHFRGRVRHWEIWNEPNIGGFWKPRKPDPADYVELVRITAPAIRQRVPEAVIVGGAFAGIPMGYIQGCLEHGLADHVDRLSYHPYRPVPEAGYEGEIRTFRQAVAQHSKTIVLWQGECGCPSRGGKGSVGALSNLEWDETRQAKWLLRRILSDLRLGVELTSYFHAVDLVGYRGQTNFKGLLRGSDYAPKPAYFAYQCLCALFDSGTKRRPELALDVAGAPGVRVEGAGFVRGGRALYAWWHPADLQKAWDPRRIALRIASPRDAALDEPVLVDPLAGRVYRLGKLTKAEGSVLMEDVPLLDYPLLLTDRAVALPGQGARDGPSPAAIP